MCETCGDIRFLKMVKRCVSSLVAAVLLGLSVTALEARAELPPSLNPAYSFLPGNAFHPPEMGDSSGGGGTGEEKGEILTISLLLGLPLLVLLVGFISDLPPLNT
jgi:hypothetical protein